MRSQSMSVAQVSFVIVVSCFSNSFNKQVILKSGSFDLAGVQAIKKFAEVRPPGIYKNDYIEALYTFYHEKRLDSTPCPSTPEWKRELDLNGEAVPDDDDDGVPAAALHVCIL